MWPIAVVVGSLLVMICGFVWVARRDELAQIRAVGALSLRPLVEVEPGELVAVSLETDEVGVEPIEGAPSSWWRAAVTGFGQKTWEGIALVTSGDELRCAGGRAVVELDSLTARYFGSAQLELNPKERESRDSLDTKMHEVVTLAGRTVDDGHVPPVPGPFTLTYASLPVGTALTVVGRARSDEGESAASQDGYRGESVPVLRFRRDDVLILSRDSLEVAQRRELESARSMRAMLAIAAAVGLASIAIGVWLALG